MHQNIKLEHGSGGRLTSDLIKEVFLKELGLLKRYQLEDSYIFTKKLQNRIAFTTDSYVVNPIFFPGGDIGRLCVCGTVNDLSVSGATPMLISAGFIIEEGFSIDDLKRILRSIKKACKEAGVEIVCGDTKVVEKGKADGIFINTAGMGFFERDIKLSYKNPRPGDVVIINGEIASHGIAVLNERHKLGIEGDIKSDVSPLNRLISRIRYIEGLRCMKDLTRGGLAEGLIEISESCGYGIEINESSIPIKASVRSACEVLGIDPLYVANEGKVVVIAREDVADEIVKEMRKDIYGRKTSVIGRVVKEKGVYLNTLSGMRRMVVSMSGEQLPRIC